MPSPTLEKEQPHQPVCAGDQEPRKQLCRIGPGGPGGQAAHETVMCPSTKEGEQHMWEDHCRRSRKVILSLYSAQVIPM